MTEEEIRGNLLLPFLDDLGFDRSEIFLETGFTIKLGKSKHVTGRSDILCKRNGKNLFVIELKSDSNTIKEDDIEQGISYAKALENNIAPFTIITNGRTTKIFDTISKNELTGTTISKQSSFWKNGCTLSTDEELNIRYDALKKFVSFSPENLKLFCEKQVHNRMGTIIGTIDEPYSKFVKELYCQRKDLQFNFDNFISSDSIAFGIVGSAGVGKTNAMCSLALQSLDNRFVFFYNAALIGAPLEHVAYDLNIVFSNKSEKDTILKRLDELGKYINKEVLIFIDAIDESLNSKIAIELSEIVHAAKNLDMIKIIISCKTNVWENILILNDTPTHLYEELNKFHTKIADLNNTPGFLLEDFSNEELKDMIPLYKKVFGFKGQISVPLVNELRNGFFLRIFSEVYNHKQIPETINDKDLIKKYINQSLKKSSTEITKGLRILAEIGTALIKHDYKYWEAFEDKGLNEERLLDMLDFSLDETLPRYLFDRNILIKSNNEDSVYISFYYSKIRDYIICFHSYKLDQLTNDEFYNVLDQFYGNYIGQSAITFYINNASFNHLETLIKFKKDKSLKYVNLYNSYLEYNFKRIKERFNPFTKSDIGILLPKDLLKDDGYALFPLTSSSIDKMLYDDFAEPFPDLFFGTGARIIHGSNVSLMVPDQSKTVQQNIFRQLKEIIKEGRLSAYNSDILLIEQVSTIHYYYFQKLGYDFNIEDFYLPRFNLIYPIKLEDLRNRIYKFRAAYYFKEKKVDPILIPEKVEEALKKNLVIPRYSVVGGVPPFEELFKIVNILLEKGYHEIEKHYLPYPDISVIEAKTLYHNSKDNLQHARCIQYSSRQAKLYIEEFFKHLESCYKEFVEYCFPTFKDELPFFSTIPHEYVFYIEDSDVLKRGMFGYRSSKDKKSKVIFKEYNRNMEAFMEDRLSVLRGFSFDNIIYNDYYNRIKTIGEINTPKVDDFCVIRNWVFRFLKEDMEKLFEENDEFI